MSKRLGGMIGCKYKTSSWHLNGFPDGTDYFVQLLCRGFNIDISVRRGLAIFFRIFAPQASTSTHHTVVITLTFGDDGDDGADAASCTG